MRTPTLVLLALISVGCGAPPVAVPTYFKDIQPLVERSCQGCHREGGPAPFTLTDPNKAVSMAAPMYAAIEAERMPPFFASGDCNDYRDDPRLSDAEKQTFKNWVDTGAPLGSEAEARHADPLSSPAVRHDVAMDLGAPFDTRAVSGTSESDNYHCFVLDPGNAADLKVSGFEVVPGNRALVHHVLAYVIAPDKLATLQALDDAAPGPGYPCMSGGVGIQGAALNQIAGWVPGAAPTVMPEGSALNLPAGSRIVMQIHYNLAAIATGASPYDETQLALQTESSTTMKQAQVLPMLQPNLNIAAYDSNSVQVKETAAGVLFPGANVYRLMGHMHQLGKQVKLEVVHSNGATQCLLDIKKWNFNWQRDYELERPYTLKVGDKLRITCVYDNSAEHQPWVNGAQSLPRNVTWGEGTTDEMCMTYLTFTRP